MPHNLPSRLPTPSDVAHVPDGRHRALTALPSRAAGLLCKSRLARRFAFVQPTGVALCGAPSGAGQVPKTDLCAHHLPRAVDLSLPRGGERGDERKATAPDHVLAHLPS